jgi:gamma-aminobutyric acid type B receptor
MSLWFVILILYKGLLMVTRCTAIIWNSLLLTSLFQFYGLFLSWKTRHVSIPALNDSRYIGLSVYVVFIFSTLGSLVIFIPSEQIQLSYFLTSFFIVICTTATVCLVFVPKVSYQRSYVLCRCYSLFSNY